MNERLKSALAALEKPLRFATKSEASLARVRDLEATLREGAERALWFASELEQTQLRAFVAALPEPHAPERFAALTRARAILAELLAPEAPPENPPSTAPSKESPTLALDAPIQFVKGVGPKLGERLRERNLDTVEALLRYFPRRYEDRKAATSVRDLREGMHATFAAEVLATSYKAFGGRRSLDVMVGDASGVVQLRWFRVPGKGFAERFTRGQKLVVSGAIKSYRGRLQIVHPELSSSDIVEPQEAGLVPIYSEIEGLRPAHLRRIMAAVLPVAETIPERLPRGLLDRHGLPTLASAVVALHKPPAGAKVEVLERMESPWHRRLIYEELLVLELAMLERKQNVKAEPGEAIRLQTSLVDTAKGLFPFALTGAQARALAEIEKDVKRPAPMQRLLQGDVGSGKTAVAFTTAAALARAGYQTAIMAPTELLAEQHFRTAHKSLRTAGTRVEFLTGGLSAAERRRILLAIKGGEVDVVIGTHALIQDDVAWHRLALAIVDEQHRFGVLQRAQLLRAGQRSLGKTPHLLVMTATPIPRTLALSAYGDLDLTLIDELPPGRTPIKTKLFSERTRSQVYAHVRKAVEAGRQAYIVFPLVEESEGEGFENVKDATSAALELSEGELKGLSIGLLHGRLPAVEKDRIMQAFSHGELDVLVATTVIEVGIDVPNASVMVIEHAERYGLSQLHQLRGRVGRGAHESQCYLVASYAQSDEAHERLAVMEETNDGFRIAEADLRIRGPGDFLGTRQSGMPMLSLADLVRDQKFLLAARADAEQLLAEDPRLRLPEHRGLRVLLANTARLRTLVS